MLGPAMVVRRLAALHKNPVWASIMPPCNPKASPHSEREFKIHDTG